jgi:hypothetical protein
LAFHPCLDPLYGLAVEHGGHGGTDRGRGAEAGQAGAVQEAGGLMAVADKGKMQNPKQRRAVGRTQWAAQFAVASELCKRGYEVSFTLGNATPLADLMVVSPVNKRMFLVDVKGLYLPNPWPVRRKPARDGLYYVLTFVPDDVSNRFFVMTQEQINGYVQQELVRLGRPDDYPMTGILWRQAERHENA